MENRSPAPERPLGPVYGSLRSPDERNCSMPVHLSALSSLVSSGFGGTLGPLIAWLIRAIVAAVRARQGDTPDSILAIPSIGRAAI